MQILVCGGGNAAHTLVGLISAQGARRVDVYLSFDDEQRRWRAGLEQQGGITVHLPGGDLFGRPDRISADPAQVVPQADMVLLALPAFAHEKVLHQIAPYLKANAWIGALPARGAFDLCARQALKDRAEQVVLFGLQTLPWACRVESFGRSVRVLGTKAQVDLACWPAEATVEVAAVLTPLLGLQVEPIANFLSLTLAGTGQLIHPGIMFGLFRNWDGQLYESPPLFYQSVDSSTAEVLEAMSTEIQALRLALEARFPEMDFSAVRPLREWLLISYPTDIEDASSLKSAFVTNRSYTGLRAPMRTVEGGLAPDFQGRYLSEDVHYGLVPTRGIAELAGVPTPQIDGVITWAQGCLGQEYLVAGKLCGNDLGSTPAPQRFGYQSIEALVEEPMLGIQDG